MFDGPGQHYGNGNVNGKGKIPQNVYI